MGDLIAAYICLGMFVVSVGFFNVFLFAPEEKQQLQVTSCLEIHGAYLEGEMIMSAEECEKD